jgi:hypothetical protein
MVRASAFVSLHHIPGTLAQFGCNVVRDEVAVLLAAVLEHERVLHLPKLLFHFLERPRLSGKLRRRGPPFLVPAPVCWGNKCTILVARVEIQRLRHVWPLLARLCRLGCVERIKLAEAIDTEGVHIRQRRAVRPKGIELLGRSWGETPQEHQPAHDPQHGHPLRKNQLSRRERYLSAAMMPADVRKA